LARTAAHAGRRLARGLAAAACAWALAACGSRPQPLSTAALATQTAGARPTESANPTPVSYTTPHPAPRASLLDGSYARIDSSWPQWWKCLRCADYRPSGGIWRLSFDQGMMRVHYEVTGWHSLASYVVEGDRLTIFNDPYCPEEVSEYTWELRGGELSLRSRKDACSFGLRAENFETSGWGSCSAGGSLPAGCADPLPPDTRAAVLPGLTVTTQSGDSRFFADPPEGRAYANAEDVTPPAGTQIRFSPLSIGYGLNRVLWWEGNWIELSSELPVAALGVQFLGAPQIGWARILLDGQEVWRGNTAELGYTLGQYGGYVEISGFDPAAHTLRVESMGWDYRPVTVASFGYRTGE
jgi:hypothetical protein